LNRYRILQAQKLLLTTEHNVTEIGAMVGFNDPAYFVRIFHRETGKSPQHYRKSTK
jgi:YesN/AraC family two-component response regulator